MKRTTTLEVLQALRKIGLDERLNVVTVALLVVLERSDAEAKIAAAAAEQAAAAVDPAEAARALIRTEVEFDRKVDGRYFYRLRHADDIEAKSIYRRRAGNGEGVALSVGRDEKNAEHVLQVLFDEDLWNATTAHDYLVQHYSVEYSRRLESALVISL